MSCYELVKQICVLRSFPSSHTQVFVHREVQTPPPTALQQREVQTPPLLQSVGVYT